ncbi:hypothetical protein [Sphingomonas fuzhouensis]|uniref:hypothetical protein n=1 Tax=Sphingomonas fuzhouensis TaxID=3106033 RepID=UPI002B000DE9|nr:hypothetical protein [Sphingomonas sp. SGZ-02]
MADQMVTMLVDCLTAVRARVDQSGIRHASAIRAEREAIAARDAARLALVAAEAAWHRQMADRFDPMLGSLLAGEVRARATALTDAEAAQGNAEQAVAQSAATWQAEDARRRAIEAQAAAARRRARHRADERLLATLADRETFRRSAR